MVMVSGWRWCHQCGYRVAGQELPVPGAQAADTPAKPSAPAAGSELALATRVIPLWGWALLIGLGLVAAVSCVADIYLPVQSRQRALWSTTQILVGVVLLFLAGLAVSTRLGLQRDHMSLLDLFMLDRLWPRALKNLPHTRWHVCTAAWSVALILCGLLWVGGLTYWLPGATRRTVEKGGMPKLIKIHPPKDTNAAAEEVVDESAETKPEDKAKQTTEAEPNKRSTYRCIIVGYTVQDNEPAGLLVATITGGEMYYSGIVPLENDPVLKTDLKKRFEKLKTDTPVFPDLRIRAVWLHPKLSCDVDALDSEDERLKDPHFKGLVFPKKPQPVPLPTDAETPAPPAGKGAGKSRDTGPSKDSSKSSEKTKADSKPKTQPPAGKSPSP